MASWRPDDEWYDRQEALGETLELEGDTGWYSDWLGPMYDTFVRPIDRLIEMFEAA